jgi:leucyl aminopeptidase
MMNSLPKSPRIQIKTRHPETLDDTDGEHLAFVFPTTQPLTELPVSDALLAYIARRKIKLAALGSTPLTLDFGARTLSFIALDPGASPFERHTQLRKGLAPLLEEHPARLGMMLYGDDTFRHACAADAVYVASANGVPLPTGKSGESVTALKTLVLYGVRRTSQIDAAAKRAEANRVCRAFTGSPPNALTPQAYRQRIEHMAGQQGWAVQTLGFEKLKKMGAGAFCAVAQGSPRRDAGIIQLQYRGKKAAGAAPIALVGKGICFDTGGHNLKPARYMQGMHEDMNGSAVALGILHAVTALKLPVNLDVWLALAENHIGPEAYRQNEVVTALNGTTIEIVHTDAEGRMVLADTLTLAARAQPAAIIDFATLTGSMHVALGTRYSGIFSNRDALADQALAAGHASGERVCRFPMDADYEPALESRVADIKQCTLDGEADHILAARFLARFISDTPWLHVDLSAHNCKGGLGAIADEITGFGVGWGVSLLTAMAA